jgi:hypothetical protein
MNTNSPADIERDAERVRAEIANTAEHLKAKVSPGQLMDEVVDYFKAGDANVFVGNLKLGLAHDGFRYAVAVALVERGLPRHGPAHVDRFLLNRLRHVFREHPQRLHDRRFYSWPHRHTFVCRYPFLVRCPGQGIRRTRRIG